MSYSHYDGAGGGGGSGAYSSYVSPSSSSSSSSFGSSRLEPADKKHWKSVVEILEKLPDEESEWGFATMKEALSLRFIDDSAQYLQAIAPEEYIHLKKVRNKLNMSYHSNAEVLADIRRVCTNALRYYSDPSSDSIVGDFRRYAWTMLQRFDIAVETNPHLKQRLLAEGIRFRVFFNAFPGATPVIKLLESFHEANWDDTHFLYYRDGYYHPEDNYAEPDDYKDFIKKPMTLSDVFVNLASSKYVNYATVKADVDLCFSNYYIYYAGSEEGDRVQRLQAAWAQAWNAAFPSIDADARRAVEAQANLAAIMESSIMSPLHSKRSSSSGGSSNNNGSSRGGDGKKTGVKLTLGLRLRTGEGGSGSGGGDGNKRSLKGGGDGDNYYTETPTNTVASASPWGSSSSLARGGPSSSGSGSGMGFTTSGPTSSTGGGVKLKLSLKRPISSTTVGGGTSIDGTPGVTAASASSSSFSSSSLSSFSTAASSSREMHTISSSAHPASSLDPYAVHEQQQQQLQGRHEDTSMGDDVTSIQAAAMSQQQPVTSSVNDLMAFMGMSIPTSSSTTTIPTATAASGGEAASSSFLYTPIPSSSPLASMGITSIPGSSSSSSSNSTAPSDDTASSSSNALAAAALAAVASLIGGASTIAPSSSLPLQASSSFMNFGSSSSSMLSNTGTISNAVVLGGGGGSSFGAALGLGAPNTMMMSSSASTTGLGGAMGLNMGASSNNNTLNDTGLLSISAGGLGFNTSMGLGTNTGMNNTGNSLLMPTPSLLLQPSSSTSSLGFGTSTPLPGFDAEAAAKAQAAAMAALTAPPVTSSAAGTSSSSSFSSASAAAAATSMMITSSSNNNSHDPNSLRAPTFANPPPQLSSTSSSSASSSSSSLSSSSSRMNIPMYIPPPAPAPAPVYHRPPPVQRVLPVKQKVVQQAAGKVPTTPEEIQDHMQQMIKVILSPGVRARRVGPPGKGGKRKIDLLNLTPFFQYDPQAMGAQNYLARVSQPMWVVKVANQFRDGRYANPEAMLQDLILIGENCKLYNAGVGEWEWRGDQWIDGVKKLYDKFFKGIAPRRGRLPKNARWENGVVVFDGPNGSVPASSMAGGGAGGEDYDGEYDDDDDYGDEGGEYEGSNSSSNVGGGSGGGGSSGSVDGGASEMSSMADDSQRVGESQKSESANVAIGEGIDNVGTVATSATTTTATTATSMDVASGSNTTTVPAVATQSITATSSSSSSINTTTGSTVAADAQPAKLGGRFVRFVTKSSSQDATTTTTSSSSSSSTSMDASASVAAASAAEAALLQAPTFDAPEFSDDISSSGGIMPAHYYAAKSILDPYPLFGAPQSMKMRELCDMILRRLAKHDLARGPGSVPATLEAAYRDPRYFPVLWHSGMITHAGPRYIASLSDMSARMSSTLETAFVEDQIERLGRSEAYRKYRDRFNALSRSTAAIKYSTVGEFMKDLLGLFDAAVTVHARDTWKAAKLPYDPFLLDPRETRATAMRDYVRALSREYFAEHVEEEAKELPAQRKAMKELVEAAIMSASTRPVCTYALQTIMGVNDVGKKSGVAKLAREFSSPIGQLHPNLPPEYWKVVEHPMDFGTVSAHLQHDAVVSTKDAEAAELNMGGAGGGGGTVAMQPSSGLFYSSHKPFVADVCLTLQNSILYNSVPQRGDPRILADARTLLANWENVVWPEACLDISLILTREGQDAGTAARIVKEEKERQESARRQLQAAAYVRGASEAVKEADVWIARAADALSVGDFNALPAVFVPVDGVFARASENMGYQPALAMSVLTAALDRETRGAASVIRNASSVVKNSNNNSNTVGNGNGSGGAGAGSVSSSSSSSKFMSKLRDAAKHQQQTKSEGGANITNSISTTSSATKSAVGIPLSSSFSSSSSSALVVAPGTASTTLPPPPSFVPPPPAARPGAKAQSLLQRLNGNNNISSNKASNVNGSSAGIGRPSGGGGGGGAGEMDVN